MKIVALVISYNRLKMVRRCVESLRAQTRPLDAILVVDASTQPEVRAWLDAQPDVTPLYVPDEGSAGAMHYGLQWALTQGFDWMWLFDDDVVAAPDALAQLLNGLRLRPQLQILNAFSTRENDPTRPSTGAIPWRRDPANYLCGSVLVTTAEVFKHADAEGFLDTVGGQIYQAVLVSRALVQAVGVPHREFFTRGDEVEYGLRIMRAGYPIYLYLAARATHPSSKTEYVTLFGKKFPLGYMLPQKRYLSIRNSIWIRRLYYAGHPFLPYVARRMANGLLAELFLESRTWRERLVGARIVLRAVREGLGAMSFESVTNAPYGSLRSRYS